MDELTLSLKLDHFRAYDLPAPAVDFTVGLKGQFDKRFKKHRLVSLEHFANPVDKNEEGIRDEMAHLNWYALDPATASEPERKIHMANQFGVQRLLIGDAAMLLVPTEKIEKGSRPPRDLDHYKCYSVLKGKAIGISVSLRDQFLKSSGIEVREPMFFCVPVAKKYIHGVEKIHNERAHLTIYRIEHREHSTRRPVKDQFDKYDLTMLSTAMLAVPSDKLEWSLA